MADEIVFDSERLLKKQRKKRFVILAAVLLVVLIIAAAAALILRSRLVKSYTGGGDTAYPYVWKTGSHGVITLTIDRSAAPGYLWTATETDPLVIVAETQDAEEGKTRFTLTPQAAGRAVLVFALQQEADETERLFELSALMDVTGDGKALSSTLLSVSGKQFLRATEGGADTDHPYSVRMDEDGDLVITVTDNTPPPEETETGEGGSDGDDGAEERSWTCVSGNEAIAQVLGVITVGNGAAAYVRPGAEPGTVQLSMTDSNCGAELVLELENDGSGAITLLSHSMRDGAQG